MRSHICVSVTFKQFFAVWYSSTYNIRCHSVDLRLWLNSEKKKVSGHKNLTMTVKNNLRNTGFFPSFYDFIGKKSIHKKRRTVFGSDVKNKINYQCALAIPLITFSNRPGVAALNLSFLRIFVYKCIRIVNFFFIFFTLNVLLFEIYVNIARSDSITVCIYDKKKNETTNSSMCKHNVKLF